MTDKKTFATREQLKQYLISLQNELNQKCEFNIFVHQINDWEHGGGDDKEAIINGKIEGILNNGLSVNSYSSIFGTTIFIGSTSQPVADAIIDYNYHRVDSYPTCVIAIPKYIEIDGKQVEFSSYKSNSEQAKQEIAKAFQDAHLFATPDHRKSSLLDVVKGSSKLPTYYILGIKKQTEQGYEFVENTQSLKNSNEQEFENYKQKVAEKICHAADVYGTTNPIEMMLKSYKSEEKWREDQLDDFD